MIILWCILGFVLGSTVLYLILRPRIKAQRQLDKETEERNKEIWQENEDLDKLNALLRQSKESLNSEIKDLTIEIDKLQIKQENMTTSIEQIGKQAEQAGRSLEESAIAIASMNIEKSAEEMSNKYQTWIAEMEQEYLVTLQEATEEYNQQLEEKKEKISSLQKKYDDLLSITEAAIAERKRAAAEQDQKDFYRLNLSSEDIQEIKRLREVLPYLRDKEPLNKVIYKTYYEKPYTDLVGRVIGQGTKSGIYKITNTLNGMCYIGQSVNISERWRQHIKRGVGAEPPTRNKLYPIMLEVGVENFSFELIEECPSGQLDTKEDFWQEYFHAKDFGYSMK